MHGTCLSALAWVKVNEDDFQVLLRFGDHDDFSVTYPEDYPNTDDAFVRSAFTVSRVTLSALVCLCR